MRLSDLPITAPTIAALFLIAGCGGKSPTQSGTDLPGCHNPVFADAAASPYCLPFAPGAVYTVTQSYCAPPPGSHQGRFAYDFDLPMGTEVLAARAGEVVELREHWSDQDTQGGHENVVILRHSDATLSLYIHMRQDGVLVEMGDYVPQGGLLGWSGSSGTFSPHIHFQVCLRGGQCSTGTNEITLPVNFRNTDGPVDTLGGLVNGATYRALACG
jgi:murein DD-endopeptidase MepM/ murein hydrolase activator NlpD